VTVRDSERVGGGDRWLKASECSVQHLQIVVE
jgi:hypothetical protein